MDKRQTGSKLEYQFVSKAQTLKQDEQAAESGSNPNHEMNAQAEM
jgi:hypothetical protein